MPGVKEQVKDGFKDAAYVAIGLGVIGFQKAQVRRRELTKHVDARTEQLRAQLEQRTKVVQDTVGSLLKQRLDHLDKGIGAALDQVGERLEMVEPTLPEPAQQITRQVYTQAKEVRSQIRNLLGKYAA
jgi:hypothetical protein